MEAGSRGRPSDRRLPVGLVAAALTAVFCLIGMGLLFRATRLGPIVWTDSVIYLSMAKGWLNGLGFIWPTCVAAKPVTVYPPLFPLLLAGFGALHVDLVEAGRLVNIAAYGLSGAMVAVLAARASKAAWAAPVAALLFLVAPNVVSTHLGLMTDGPYLTFCLMALLFLESYTRTGRMALLIAAGAAAGMAYLTRYIGMALVLASWLFLVLKSTRLRSLIREALVFGVVSLAPIVVWYGRNFAVSGAMSAYRILLRPIDLQALLVAPRLIADWLLPGFVMRRIPESGLVLLSSIAIPGLLAAGLLLARGARRGQKDEHDHRSLALAVLSFLLVYLGVFLASAVAVFIPPTISERYLVPAYGMVVVLGTCAAVGVWRKTGWPVRTLIVVAGAALVWNKAAWSRGLLGQAHADGLAYTSVAWRNSETIAEIAALGPSMIYTNDVAAVAFLADRPACTLPDAFQVPTAEVDWNAEARESYVNRMREEGTILVLFERAPLESYSEVTRGLTRIRTCSDGWIFAARDSAN